MNKNIYLYYLFFKLFFILFIFFSVYLLVVFIIMQQIYTTLPSTFVEAITNKDRTLLTMMSMTAKGHTEHPQPLIKGKVKRFCYFLKKQVISEN